MTLSVSSSVNNKNDFQVQPRRLDYQGSGIPWISGSALLSANFATQNSEVKFSPPAIYKSILIMNTLSGSNVGLRVHFASVKDGTVLTARHYFPLYNFQDFISGDIIGQDIFVSLMNSNADGDVTIIASTLPGQSGSVPFTNQSLGSPVRGNFVLTGSGITGLEPQS